MAAVELLNPVLNCARIQNCIEDYIAFIHPFDLQIGWLIGNINYLHPGKPEDSSTGYIAFDTQQKDRMKLKTARYLTRKCELGKNTILNDEQIRELAEKINSLLWTEEELNNTELICGDAITEAYNNEIGGSSCMTGANSDYTGLYASNPTRFQMLIIRNGNDSARAIIHKLDNGQKLLGVIYATAEHLLDMMEKYAVGQNWITDKRVGGSDKNSWVMSNLHFCDGEIPYMDMLTSGEINNELLTVSYNFGDFELQNQDGSLDGGYHCENCGDHVHEDDTYNDNNGNTYCEYCFNENFMFCPDCEDVVHNNDTVHIQDKGIYVCQGCADKNFYKCETCDDYFELDSVRIFNDNAYCENCFDEIADYCENCNEAFHTEDLIIASDSGPLCKDCAVTVQEAEGITT